MQYNMITQMYVKYTVNCTVYIYIYIWAILIDNDTDKIIIDTIEFKFLFLIIHCIVYLTKILLKYI